MPAEEAALSSASKMAVLFTENTAPEESPEYVEPPRTMILCITETGSSAKLITKYRPPCPVVVATKSDQVLRQCSAFFGQRAIKVWQ